MNDQIIKLVLDMGASGANVDEVKRKLEELGPATEKAARSSANLGRTALESGRILQDFAQGGIGGILNNIEGFVSAIGGGPALAGIFTAVGLAVYFALPKVKDFFAALIDGSNEIPKSKDRLENLNEEIKRGAKELDALREKHVLTNTELARFNELTATQTRLQKEANEAKKQAAEIERLKAMKSEQERETGAMVSEFIGPDVEGVIAAAQGGAIGQGAQGGRLGQLYAELRQMQATAAGLNEGRGSAATNAMIKRYQAAIEAERERLRQQATAAVTGATQGDEAALGRLIGFLPQGQARAGLEQLTPGARQQQEAEYQAEVERGQQLHEAGERRRATAAEEQQRREQQARWETEGRRNARQYEQQQAREKAQAEAAFTSEVMAAAAPEEAPRERQMRQARRGVSQASQQMGYGMPSPQQADEMATQALRYMANGIQADAAMWMSVEKKVEAINTAAREFYEMRERQVQKGFGGLPR